MKFAFPLVDLIDLDGKNHQIDLSFDVVLRVFELLEDRELSDSQKIDTALYLLLGFDIEGSIKDRAELLNVIFENYILGQDFGVSVPVDIQGNPMPIAIKKAPYDFNYDAEYIYSSFVQAYGIDLFEAQGKLHWKKFVALIKGLPEDTMLMRIIDIRTRELPTGKGTSKERAQLQKLKNQYKLPEE